jgi:hypothetical protein
MRKAYLFIEPLVSCFRILDLCSEWIFCRLVQHGLRNASRTAPLDHSTRTGVFGMTFNGRLTIAALPY